MATTSRSTLRRGHSTRAITGPAISGARRAAFEPTGEAIANATRFPSAYSTAPARSVQSPVRGDEHEHDGDQDDRPQRAERVRLGPALREGDRQQPDRYERAGGRGEAGEDGAHAPLGGVASGRVRGARQRREQRRHRAGQGREDGEDDGDPGAPALEGERAPHGWEHPEREREPAREQVAAGGQAEPQRSEPPVAPVPAPRERLEQPRGRGGGERRRELRGDRRCDGREQDAVAGDVVAAVPPVVPDPEPLGAEQLGPQQVGREVEAGRRDDHVDRGQHAGGQRGREPAQVESGQPHRQRAPAPCGERAHSKNLATASSTSGRSIHGQCPAPATR